MTLFCQPSEEAAQRYEAPVYGRHCLTTDTAQPITEVGQITDSHSACTERLLVRLGEPPDKLSHVLSNRLSAIQGKILTSQKLVEKTRFVRSDRDTLKNIIA
jgi:hypothetical protein